VNEKDVTKLPWRVEADSPACFGPDGLTVGTVVYDARHRRVLRLCPAGTRGAGAAQAQAAAMVIVALAAGAATASDAMRASRAPRRTVDASADVTAEAPRP
jgi:hypothetical protein